MAPRVTAAEYAAVVGSTFAARQLDLAKAMRDASSTVAPGHLKDFDWKVQVSGRTCSSCAGAVDLGKIAPRAQHMLLATRYQYASLVAQVMLSSDKMSEIRQPVLSLKMDVATDAGAGGEKSIVVEMTKDEADAVLRSMGAAYQHMEKLKA